MNLRLRREWEEDAEIQGVIVDTSGSTKGVVLKKIIKEVTNRCQTTPIDLISFDSKAIFHGRCEDITEFQSKLSSLSSSGSTQTSRAFKLMLFELGKNMPARHIYHVLLATDGQMDSDCAEPMLKAILELQALLATSRGIELRISLLTVSDSDTMSTKAIARGAGGDVMQCFSAHKNLLSSFVTFLPQLEDQGHVHFQFVRPRDSEWIAFDEETFFHINDLPWFVSTFLPERLQHILGTIPEQNQQDLVVLRLLQQTALVLKNAQEKGKSVACINGIAQTVQFLLPTWSSAEALMLLKELMDEGIVYLATVKERRRSIFAEASKNIRYNTRLATGMSVGITLPLLPDSTIYISPYSKINHTVSGRCMAGFLVNGVKLPCLPGHLQFPLRFAEEQCSRQTLRTVAIECTPSMSRFQIDESNYIILPYFLLLNLRIAKSNAKQMAKNMYSRLAFILLQMKRTNAVDKTEMASLLEGNLLLRPVPIVIPVDSKSDLTMYELESSLDATVLPEYDSFFHDLLQSACFYAGVLSFSSLDPLTCWWGMCVAVNYKPLLEKQWPIVKEKVKQDFHLSSDDMCLDLQLWPDMGDIKVVELEAAELEYKCPISWEDTSKGGFVLRPHGECYPCQVFEQPYALENIGCPFCHMPLVPSRDYIEVGPQETKKEQQKVVQNPVPMLSNSYTCSSTFSQPTIKQLIFEATLIPIIGQGAIVDLTEFGFPDAVDKILRGLTGILGLDADGLKHFFQTNESVIVFGSFIGRILQNLAFTDLDIAFIGSDQKVLSSLDQLFLKVQAANQKTNLIIKHTSGGVFTVSNLNCPIQFVRCSQVDGSKSADDILSNSDSPTTQCCLFSLNGQVQLKCSVHFLDWMQTNLIKWWKLSCPQHLARAIKCRDEYKFPMSLGLLKQINTHPLNYKLKERAVLKQAEVPFTTSFSAVELEPYVKPWLEGISKHADNYDSK
jgi:hypothetical protein